jgi:hypothetical protein
MFCTSCGSPIEGAPRYCSKCGTRLESTQPVVTGEQGAPPAPASDPPGLHTEKHEPHRHGLFGGKKDLEAEVARLQAALDQLGVAERDALQHELVQLRAEVPALRQERDTLSSAVEPLRTETAQLQELKSQSDALRSDVERLTAERSGLDTQATELKRINEEIVSARSELAELAQTVVETQDIAILQEVGVYQFAHVLDSAVAYQTALKEVQTRVKDFNRAGGHAITAATNWTVNGSKSQGQKMVNEVSKLMLRAYNGEVDDAVRTLKPYKIAAAIDRLNKVRASIEKLGKTMSILVSAEYHATRIEELKLTADFLQKQAEEKEAQKAERERLREEAQAQREIAAKQALLDKEQAHHEAVLQQARETGNEEAARNAEEKLAEIEHAKAGLAERAANIRAGYVYVVSNIGSFGEDVVKIGLTRRLEYEDRIHELSGASVPFIFDIHAVIYSDDAVSLEHQLHHELEGVRLNRVNTRKEFFRTTPFVVKDLLEKLAGSHLMVFHETAEAAEWRMSQGNVEQAVP